MAAALLRKYEWDFAVRDGVVHDHSLPGSPEYHFYRLTPTRAFGYGADGLTATRWRFVGPSHTDAPEPSEQAVCGDPR